MVVDSVHPGLTIITNEWRRLIRQRLLIADFRRSFLMKGAYDLINLNGRVLCQP